MKTIKDYNLNEVFKDFEGVDVCIETSLLEYGLIWTDKAEDCEEGELFFIANLGDGIHYDSGYVSHGDLDWTYDDESFFSFLGLSLEEWMKTDLGHKVYDVVNYYGAQELFRSYSISLLDDFITLYTEVNNY